MSVFLNRTVEHLTYNGFVSLDLVNDRLLFVFEAVNWGVLCGIINVIGVVSNAINMAVFRRTGFKDSITISLFALAVSDFGSCFACLPITFLSIPPLLKLELLVVTDEVAYLIGSWPHLAFAKITTMITAFITVERCLCVSMPFKVKQIITRRRVVAYVAFCFLFNTASLIPLCLSNRLDWKFNAARNKTIYGVVFLNEKDNITRVINVFISMSGFVVIIVAAILLIVKLKESARWRVKATSTPSSTSTTAMAKSGTDESATKEQKVTKMVTMIATLFIVCFLPTAAFQVAKWLDRRRMAIDGEYKNFNEVVASVVYILESVNSAFNIFIYYTNNSKYKTVFDQMFRAQKHLKNERVM